MTPRTFTAVACPACGILCDDLAVTVAGERIRNVQSSCPRAKLYFVTPPLVTSAATIDGTPATLDAAIARAAAILSAARNPLIVGFARSTAADQRAGIALAERLGATLDLGPSPVTRAMQDVGLATCTLGDLRDRADCVIAWFCDPATSHPRFFERFIDAPGRFTPKGRAERFLAVVDDHDSPTAKIASVFLNLNSAGQWETLESLRLHLAGKPVTLTPVWSELLDRMKTCRFGVLLIDDHSNRRVLESLFPLVAELNAATRFCAIPLRQTVSGAEDTLAWQTGYAGPVSFANGAPLPASDSASLLRRGAVDAVLIAGSESVELPDKLLKDVPVIRLDPPSVQSNLNCAVTIATANYGLQTPGYATRLDGVTIPLTVLLPSSDANMATVLPQIQNQLTADSSDSRS